MSKLLSLTTLGMTLVVSNIAFATYNDDMNENLRRAIAVLRQTAQMEAGGGEEVGALARALELSLAMAEEEKLY